MNMVIHRQHLGLGDHIICNAITRDLCRKSDVVFMPVKPHNVESVRFMFRDLSNLVLIPVTDDQESEVVCRWHENSGCKPVYLGFFGPKPFDPREFDVYFYRQYGMSPEAKWSGWKADRDLAAEVNPPRNQYVLLHDDPSRGFTIDRSRILNGLPIVHMQDFKVKNLFMLCSVIEGATEVHCINSCTMNLIEHLNPTGRLIWHFYPRPENTIMKMRKNWIRIS